MRTRSIGPLLVLLAAALSCTQPHLPPTTVPASPDPALSPFERAIQAYVNQTQPYRKEAAQQQNKVPAAQGGAAPNAAVAVRARQVSLATALQTQIRPNAQPGEIFSPAVASIIKKDISDAFASEKRALLIDELAEQNEEHRDQPSALAINQHVNAPQAPPLLLESLPPLPKQLEYDFLDQTLILRDVDADVVVDYLSKALPVNPQVPAPEPNTAATPEGAKFLAMPKVRGGTVFVLMGDNGSGDEAQAAVAAALVRYFDTATHFPFVLLLGDNLYDDDYQGEFLTPYKPLLERGVTFRASLGNHDRDLEQHFKPFNMEDRDYYTFDEGNARFAVLNSNHPDDPAQLKWLDGVFTDAGTKWRICYFHHPLYSSGIHRDSSRDVIRPALEPGLMRNHVNVVFSGHEHLYERVAPQHGIRYFVSGGGGRNLYGVHRSDFDEVADSVHHFMVIEIAGDAMYYEAVRPTGETIDCGMDWRTDQARAKGPDDTGRKWLDACHAATAVRTTHR